MQLLQKSFIAASELAIPKRTSTNKANAESETQTVEARINKRSK